MRCASIAASRSFVEVLPVEPVIAIDLGAERAAPRARERLQPGERVLGREQHAGVLARVVARVLGRDEHAPRAGRERRRGEAAAVDVRAAQADEEVARAARRASRS